MARLPSSAPPTLTALMADEFQIDLEVITPMFGGSARARELNPEHPVRAASIRGQLRFWWRATAGAAFSTHKELLDAESRIWGCMASPGQEKKGKDGQNIDPVDVGRVSVSVETLRGGERRTLHDLVPTRGRFPEDIKELRQHMAYATFPFQAQKSRNISEAPFLEGVEFRLTLRGLGEDRAAILQAVTAWIQFGGVGARTRRGCGAISIISGDSLPSLHLGFSRKSQLWTLQPRTVLYGKPQDSAFDAWHSVIKTYSSFRQGLNHARQQKDDGLPGRSWFPEADTLRRMIRHSPKHRPIISVLGFPRADLGLPIVFQFKREDREAGDPPNQTLEGAKEGFSRFASPVITKVIERDGEFVPMLAVLDAPHVWEGKSGVRLKGRREAVPREQLQLSKADLQQIKPLAGRPIREALVEYARTQGFREAK